MSTWRLATIPLAALLVAACAGPRSRGEAAALAVSTETSRAGILFLIRRGWHIDVGMETAALDEPLRRLTPMFPGARYLLFGFGDRRYIETAHPGAGGLASALWPGAGVLLLTGLKSTPEAAFGSNNVIAFAVTQDQLAGAQAFVRASFARSAGTLQGGSGDFGIPALGPYQGSLYYASSVTYSAWRTCNTWAAQALQGADLPIRSRGEVFAGQVWNQARNLVATRPPPSLGGR